MTWADGKWATQSASSFPVALDSEANTVTADVPFAMPSSGVVRAVAAIGYDDGAGHSWVTNSSPVQDLGFVVAESPTEPYLDSVVGEVNGFAAGGERNWQEYRQSAILGGTADAGPAVASIDAGMLRSRRTSLATASDKGFHTFLYTSALRLGEGVAGSGNSAVYNGPYQPYLVWVPGGMRPGLPLVLYLHGASQTHLSGVNTAQYDPSTRNEALGLPDAIFDFPAVVAWPLGRGPETWYRGAALQDPLDVADDVIARLALDRERVMLAGLSMGGYGTFKLGELLPDRWSIAYADVGADDTMLPENFTSLPVRFQNGVADPLIPLSELSAGRDPTPQRTRSLFESAATVDYRSWLVAKETHQPAVALAECVYRYSFEHPRVVNPARVRYTADRSTWLSDAATGLSLRFDRAYWVSGIEPAAGSGSASGSGSGRGTVDVTSFAFGAVPVPGPSFSGVQENVSSGRDFCGPNAGVHTHDVWSEAGRVVASAPHAVERRVTGTLRGVGAVTVAMDRAGLGGRSPWTASLSADRAVSLTLTGLAPGTVVSVGGRASTVGRGGRVTVMLAPGSNQLTGG
jgi:pimeloyl-ACP methyl ester carboxylesterase